MKVSKDMIMRDIVGETVLIPTGKTALKIHGMITLTESGKLLWEKMQNDCTEEDLVQAILSEYDVDRATAEADIQEFLQNLDQVGVLER